MREHLARAFPCDTWEENHMKIEEAWTQASETTGVDQIGVELGTGFTLLMISLEIVWWIGLGLFLNKQRLRVESSLDDAKRT